eukprot:10454883-Alexandrium_andersonii.AAC.1
MSASLVGSEMCIRDSLPPVPVVAPAVKPVGGRDYQTGTVVFFAEAQLRARHLSQGARALLLPSAAWSPCQRPLGITTKQRSGSLHAASDNNSLGLGKTSGH